MRFELSEEEVHFDAATGRVAIGLDRFRELLAYVEGLETRLWGEEPAGGAKSEADSSTLALIDPAAVEHLGRWVALFRDRGRLLRFLEGRHITVQRISDLTRISYSTLYRYLHGQAPPIDRARAILEAVAWELPEFRRGGPEHRRKRSDGQLPGTSEAAGPTGGGA
jgi:hypothetical protein